MHHLTNIKIENFRSCTNVTLELDNCTPIVGYNNAGKSNILSAIEWLVSPRVLSKADYNDPDCAVIVEGAIRGLDDSMLELLEPRHRQKLTRFILNGTLRLRRIQKEPGSGIKNVRLEVCDPEAGSQNNPVWQDQPTGIPQAIQALFPDAIFIGAMQDAAEDAAKAKSGTTLGKLIAEFTTALEQAHGAQLQGFLTEVEQRLAPGSEYRVDELKRFDREASDVVNDFFPGLKLHLDIPVPDVRTLFKQGSIKVSEHGRDAIRDFTSLGHGAQRSIQMALVRYLADMKVAGGNQTQRRLLLVEEPELFLHPQAIEQVRMALESLSIAGYQVVFATHSPMMIDRGSVASTRIVRKQQGDGKTSVMPSLREALEQRIESEDTRLYTLFKLENASGWLFSDKILLAEGKTEQRILPALYRAVTGKSLAADRISIMNLGGVGSVSGCLKAFEELGLTASAVADLDFALNQAVKHRLIDKDDEDLQACLSQIEELSKTDSAINIGDNGRPTNNGQKKAARVYREWAATEAGKSVAMALHKKFKREGIWIWPAGDIEAVLGLPGDKNELEWAEFCRRLERESFDECVVAASLVRGLFSWL